jgi:hypothetical protein
VWLRAETADEGDFVLAIGGSLGAALWLVDTIAAARRAGGGLRAGARP